MMSEQQPAANSNLWQREGTMLTFSQGQWRDAALFELYEGREKPQSISDVN